MMADKRQQKVKFEGGGLVLFEEVQQAMIAEKVLKSAGYTVKLVAPPPQLRKGCDLAVEINLVEQPGIERLLTQADASFVSIEPLKIGTAELLRVVRSKDFGPWMMVRSGNMKITFEKASGIIVNVSGGGCPDIPNIHARLLDRHLDEAPHPTDVGFTLCALMAQRAFDEALELWREGGRPC